MAIRKIVVSSVIAAVAVLSPAREAGAGTITLSDGITSQQVFDDGAGDALGTTPGIIFFSGFLDDIWQLTLFSAMTMPAVGSALDPYMNLFVSATSLGTQAPTHPLVVTFDAGVFGPSNARLTASLDNISTPSGGSVAYNTYLLDPPNSPVSLTALTTAATATAILPITSGYSLRQVITFTPTSTGTSNFSANATTDVPDGGWTVAMLGSALLAIGLLRRRIGVR